MAVTTTTQINAPLVTNIVNDTDSDLTLRNAASVSSKLYFVEITNPNTTTPAYVKLISNASAANANTATQHVMQFYCPAETTCYAYIPEGHVIASGIVYYTSNEAGVAGNLTAPSSDVTVTIGTTAT